MKGICSNKTTSNNLISNSHHELWIMEMDRWIHRESIEKRIDSLRVLFGMKLNTTCMLLDQIITT